MNILLIGSGGREHALAWALSGSPLCDALFIAPGNPGTAQCGTNLALDIADHAAVIAACRARDIGLVVVGPEAPLVAGIADALEAAGIKTFGPSKAAAALEGSKGFTKDLCAEFNIPTAAYRRFAGAEAAKAYIREQGAPIVVKADGLAAGKGVTVATTVDEALATVDDLLSEPGAEVVIEECLTGEEVSFFALCDGKKAIPFGSAQDHKRVFDGDKGPNTGGMGAYSPASVFTPELEARTMREIIQPTLDGMVARGTPFKGVLFAGLMLTAGGPKLIEYNVRFGDPECQVLMSRLRSDLVAALIAICDGLAGEIIIRWRDSVALTVVMAAQGYPGKVESGSAIKELEAAEALNGVQVFHAGTKLTDGRLVANGGRVLSVTALGDTVSQAQRHAYAAVDRIDWPQGFCRRDIGWREIEREKV